MFTKNNSKLSSVKLLFSFFLRKFTFKTSVFGVKYASNMQYKKNYANICSKRWQNKFFIHLKIKIEDKKTIYLKECYERNKIIK